MFFEITSSLLMLATSVFSTNDLWRDFEWVNIENQGNSIEKAAILMPVQIGDSQCKMQLDTALGSSVIYRPGLPKNYNVRSNTDVIKFDDFQFASIRYSKSFELIYAPIPRNRREDCGAPELRNNIGSIGSDLLRDGSLTLDLHREKFLYIAGPYIGSSNSQTQKTALSLIDLGEGSVPVISINFKSVGLQKFIVDTGSASESIGVHDKKIWKKIVGLSDFKNATSRKVPRWGKQVTCYSAPSAQAIYIDNLKIDQNVLVKYCDDPRGWPGQNKILGVVGLAFFKSNLITIDYVSKQLIIE